MKLTKQVVDKTRYDHEKRGGQYLWDDELTGFGVRIYPSERKSFLVTYRASGKQRFHTVGKFGVLTLQEARKEAANYLAKARNGGDPSRDRQDYWQSPTVDDLAGRYMREHAIPKKKPTSVRGDRYLWNRHILPALGGRKVADIDRKDIAELHTAMGHIPFAGNRAVRLLSKAFNLAETWGWRGTDALNPCRHISFYRENKRERFLSEEEMRSLAQVLERAETTQTESEGVVAAIRLLILTGCRLNEILRLRWAEVDFHDRCLRLSDSKTGRKTIYLSAPAISVLSGISREPDNPFVIRGKKSGHHLVNPNKPWGRIRELAGLEDVRLHDLRHVYASVCADIGLSLPVIGELLGHSQVSTTQRYVHLASDPVREGAEIAGRTLAQVTGIDRTLRVDDGLEIQES